MLRVGGRLANAKLLFETKHPVILPSKHDLTDLIVHSCHSDQSAHQGVSATLNNLMKRFCVVNPKVTVKRVIKQCLWCKRRRAQPKAQTMADLPPARLQMFDAPFAHTGVDYFGSFCIKQRINEIKKYGCIFMCIITRAVHLEVASDLTVSSFLNAFWRL